MTKATVHGDIHGIFVRTNGSVYRPVKTKYSYPLSSKINVKDTGMSYFLTGDKVNVLNVSSTPFCKVRNDKVEEWWHAHGQYLGKKTTDCWEPA